MRVALINGATTYWLAGNPALSEREHSSASNYRKSARVLVQESARVRAANMVAWDRANLATDMSFGTTRKFATVQAANEFALDYDGTMPRTGTLVLETPLPGGGTARRYMPAAVVEPPTMVVTGVTVEMTYTARGGRVQTTP